MKWSSQNCSSVERNLRSGNCSTSQNLVNNWWRSSLSCSSWTCRTSGLGPLLLTIGPQTTHPSDVLTAIGSDGELRLIPFLNIDAQTFDPKSRSICLGSLNLLSANSMSIKCLYGLVLKTALVVYLLHGVQSGHLFQMCRCCLVRQLWVWQCLSIGFFFARCRLLHG